MDLLLDLNQIGQTLLIVTHDQRLAERCASRVVHFDDGRVTEMAGSVMRPRRGPWRARGASGAGACRRALIGVIVTLCTATLLVGLALLAAVTGPFDRTFAQLNGAHATVLYDSAKVTEDQVAATAQADGVAASAGPFPVAITTAHGVRPAPAGRPMRDRRTRRAGRPRSTSLRLTAGRWATGPGEIVLSTALGSAPTWNGCSGRRSPCRPWAP